MKRIRFNADVEEVEAPELGTSSNSHTLDNMGELESIPSLPSRSFKKRGGGPSVSTPIKRTSIGSESFDRSDPRDTKAATGQVATKRRKSTTAQATRVVTAFRGAVIPEYKGHMPRVGHISFVYQRNFYVFGGTNSKGQYSSYIFCHEKRSLQWEEVRSVGLIPSGRANLSAIQYDNKLVIYGGNRQLDVFDDLYSYDLEANRWEKIGYERSQGPGPVFLHTAVYVPLISTMVVLGGFHQREHNMYLGHAFDLRNRIWSGLPGPRAINPQHIQLVTASYYEPKQAIVVIGLVERDVRDAETMPAPSVYFMNVHSWVWTKVSTVASPESPIPFQMGVAWDYFTRQLVTMGGFYEDVQHTWYFPLNLEPIEQAVFNSRPSVSAADGAAAPLGSSSSAQGGAGAYRKSRAQYGFFKLSLREMQWSIVPINLPRRFGNDAARMSVGAGGAAARAVRHSTREASIPASRPQKQVLGDLNLDGMSETPVTDKRPSNGGSVGRRTVTGLSPTDLTASTPAGDAAQQQALLFTVRGEPQFQRKYAYAAYRDPQTTGKAKPMQYMIMHGGAQTDASPYGLLMFTPVMTRTDAFMAQKITKQTERFDDPDQSASFSTYLHDSSQSFDADYSTPFDDADPVLALAEQQRRVNEERQDCLLPVLPCARTPANQSRFAVLFHANNSMQSNRALPYANTPAAVLERPEDVMQWSAGFYRDKRKWLADKLKVAVAEDKRLRRGARRQPGAPGGQAADEGINDDADFDPRPRMSGAGSRPSSAGSRPTSAMGGAPRGSASVMSAFDRSATNLFESTQEGPQARSTVLDADTGSTAGIPNLHTDDFFKAKGLEPFSVENAVFAGNAPRGSASEDVENPFLGQGDSPEVVPAGLERLWMKVKRHGENQRLPTAVFRGTGTVNDGTMTGDLGSAMAFLLLRNGIASLPVDDTPEKRSRRALLRWRFLRALVKTGEAAFIIYRANQRDARTKGQLITSYPGLVMAPELHLVGATRAHKVPTRPVPYTVARPPAKKAQYAEVTKSGMVAYHNIRHVK